MGTKRNAGLGFGLGHARSEAMVTLAAIRLDVPPARSSQSQADVHLMTPHTGVLGHRQDEGGPAA